MIFLMGLMRASTVLFKLISLFRGTIVESDDFRTLILLRGYDIMQNQKRFERHLFIVGVKKHY
jgi:hypothetical protein